MKQSVFGQLSRMQNDTIFIAPSDVSAMPDRRDANLFALLIGQLTQYIEINIILDKALNVLRETELFELSPQFAA
jgi:hypothetical protein